MVSSGSIADPNSMVDMKSCHPKYLNPNLWQIL